MTTYHVETAEFVDGNLKTDAVGNFADMISAMKAAKKAAGRTPRFDSHYGPSAVAYIGHDRSAIVAW